MTCPVSAILLAAGLSKRMGRPKQLLPLGEKPVIMHCLDAILEAGIKDVVVALHPEGRDIKKAIQDLSVTIVFNNTPASDMAESVRVGLQNVGADSSGILISLCDYPLIRSNTIEALVAEHGKEPAKIIVPEYRNQRGHPTLLPRLYANEIFRGLTLRDIVYQDMARIQTVEVEDAGVLQDMDTEDDYQRITQIYQSGHS